MAAQGHDSVYDYGDRVLNEDEQAALAWVDRLAVAWATAIQAAPDEDAYLEAERAIGDVETLRAALLTGNTGLLEHFPREAGQDAAGYYAEMVAAYAGNERVAGANEQAAAQVPVTD